MFFLIHAGEALEFSVQVLNDSAQSLAPILYLWEKQTFAAQSKRMVHTNDILFESADCVPPWSSQTITKALRIPPELPPTFFNCCMMKLEYRLKVTCVDKHDINELLYWLYQRSGILSLSHREHMLTRRKNFASVFTLL